MPHGVTPPAQLKMVPPSEGAALSHCRPRKRSVVVPPAGPAEAALSAAWVQVSYRAGAAIGVVAPAFQDWHKAFWDNLAASVQLHSIKRIIAIDHRDCGAAKIAYGDDSIKTYDAETALHRKVLAEFRKQCNERQPKLVVETGLISLKGRVETFKS